MRYEYSDEMVDWVVGEYRRLKGQVDEGREVMDGWKKIGEWEEWEWKKRTRFEKALMAQSRRVADGYESYVDLIEEKRREGEEVGDGLLFGAWDRLEDEWYGIRLDDVEWPEPAPVDPEGEQKTWANRVDSILEGL